MRNAQRQVVYASGSQPFQAVTPKIIIFELGTPTLTSSWNYYI